MRKLGRRLRVALPLALLILGVGYAVLAPSWERPARGTAATALPLGDGQARAVTLNAYKLRQAERVPRLIAALETTAAQLATSSARLPELIGLQEVESTDARDALVAALEETHLVTVCECVDDGEQHSDGAVLVAVSRAAFNPSSERCIQLGSVWPGRARCAAEVSVRDADGEPLTVLSAHLAWRLDDEEMAERLRTQADPGARTVWLGDFNAPEGSDAYAVLNRAPIEDARVDGPPTHYLGRRIDMVFVTDELEVIRALDRRASFDALSPSASHRMPFLPYGWADRQCESSPAECPVSDHLPEGVVLEI